MISPTPGRMVYFHPGTHDSLRAQVPDGRPLAGQIAYVWNDRMVNLQVLDTNGNPHSRTSVQLLQDDDKPSVCGEGVPGVTVLEFGHACWMPYQLGQAAKTEATALELGAEVRRSGLAGP